MALAAWKTMARYNATGNKYKEPRKRGFLLVVLKVGMLLL